ncbi:PIN-like domain-containing protein [Nocardia grenadensis]|uniref:PIN-like domain-containing protein n=1 Tax=Nocardia grenadensis TaxID=931537 RepID=UPI003D904278
MAKKGAALDANLELVRRYRAWLRNGAAIGDSAREDFFRRGLVVLDTNVLLNLYEYTPAARNELLHALERVQYRLWLPYQVGLEFVRGRHRVVANRSEELKKAPAFVNQKLQQAEKSVLEAAKHVQHLLVRYAQDADAKAQLEVEITTEAVKELLSPWNKILLAHIKDLSAGHDLGPESVDRDDPVLPRIASLYGDRVAARPAAETLRRRVEEAQTYRFPNGIPPGFADAGKATTLQAAGDYLLWEEIIDRMAQADNPGLVLLVSADTKGDWYQPREGGRSARPWPSLSEELHERTGADLRIETPQHFFQGIHEFLDVDIAPATYEELERAIEVGTPEELVLDEVDAARTEPPEGLALAAYRAAGLTTSAIRDAVQSPTHRTFQWWLIAITADTGLRTRVKAEPRISYTAACFTNTPPAPHWESSTVLRASDWPQSPASWVAPWFSQVYGFIPRADRLILHQLALAEPKPHAVTGPKLR